MSRLTQHTPTGASLILDNPQTAEEAREQLMQKFKLAANSLAALEDILYTVDGTARITLESLKALVDGYADGRALLLPCKVGDTVYIRGVFLKLTPFKIDQISVDKTVKIHAWFADARVDYTFMLDEIGKTVLLNHAAAKAALAILEGGI